MEVMGGYCGAGSITDYKGNNLSFDARKFLQPGSIVFVLFAGVLVPYYWLGRCHDDEVAIFYAFIKV